MKISKSIRSLTVVAFTCLGLVGCGNDEKSENRIAVENAVKEAMKLDRDALFQKAADELQDGTFKWVGCSSRAKKAADAFKKKLVEKNPKCENATFVWDVLDDGHIYTKLVGDINAEVDDGYDGALVQDGYQLALYGDQFVNYVPKEWEGDKSINGDPFALQFNFKTWLVNDSDGEQVIPDNVWDFLDTGKVIHSMDPNNENVNRDWLIMLTKDENNNMLKEAWNALTDAEKAAKVSKPDDFADKGDKKYAYAFISGYIKNAQFKKDDGEAVNNFAVKSAKGNYAWIVYSKMMNLKESDEVSKSYIVSPSLGKDIEDGNKAVMKMKGFSGFMYKHYLQVMPTSKHPYTTCALINLLSTTPEGYKGWAVDIGDYPTMASININRTKFGHGTLDAEKKYTQKDSDPNLFPVMNDPTGEWWTSKTGGRAIVEEPSYIGDHYDEVNNFIVAETGKKK